MFVNMTEARDIRVSADARAAANTTAYQQQLEESLSRPYNKWDAALLRFHAATGPAPTPINIIQSGTSIQEWAAAPDDGTLANAEAWAAERCPTRVV